MPPVSDAKQKELTESLIKLFLLSSFKCSLVGENSKVVIYFHAIPFFLLLPHDFCKEPCSVCCAKFLDHVLLFLFSGRVRWKMNLGKKWFESLINKNSFLSFRCHNQSSLFRAQRRNRKKEFNYKKKTSVLPANDCDEPWRRSGLAMYIKNIRKFFTPIVADNRFSFKALHSAFFFFFLCEFNAQNFSFPKLI